MTDTQKDHDVVILGGGLAGQTLARHLLLETDKTVLIVDRKAELPGRHQKVGESSVQVAGFYFSKILDMEEYLLREHFMKYNLRFYWRSGGRSNQGFEDYSHASIRPFSNIASYQLNRNTFEAELLRRNLEDERFELRAGAHSLEVDLVEESAQNHCVRFTVSSEQEEVHCGWVVDTTGRKRALARQLDMRRPTAIQHNAFFWWVDGLVDIDKLSDLSRREMRKRPDRAAIGHLPFWMATNHFMDEGMWFWVIPLQGKTSLGLVYDPAVVPHEEVFSVEKATRFVCERFPLFARDLPYRKVLDSGGYRGYAHDCTRTISPSRWAMTGEAGRFSDPLYSPGSDLISFYNTLVVDAIATDDPEELQRKCPLFEQIMKAVFQAYIPSYAKSYDVLGDAEAFTLKYTWELSIYFAYYVFPFINELVTDRRFAVGFLRLFGKLGPMNQGVQELLSDFFQWKKEHRGELAEPAHFDFMEIGTLRQAERTFYKMTDDPTVAKKILSEQLENIEELARFIAAHVAATVVGDDRLRLSQRFVESLDVTDLRFDPEAWKQFVVQDDEAVYNWSWDPFVMDRFKTGEKAAVAAEVTA